MARRSAIVGGEFLAMLRGDVYSDEEMNAWPTEAGCRPLERLPLAGR